MNKARETILRLVSEGKITVEEADELLDAIEKGSRPPFADLFNSSKQAAARAKDAAKAKAREAREKVRVPRARRDKEYGYRFRYDFNFPWEQPDWQWPWEKPDWQWPWEKPGARKPESEFDVPEGAQLRIRNNGGDLVIRGAIEPSLIRFIGLHAASKVATEGNVIQVSSTGTDLVIEAPERIVSVEVAQTGGDMKIEKLEADLVAKIAGGDMSISGADGKIQASVDGGDASLADIKSTETEVRANAGDISLKMLPSVKEGSVSLSTDNGDISLVLPPDSQCQISANAAHGDITHSLPPESAEISDETDTYLNAKLNGGGADFVLSTKTGDIDIKASAPPA